DHPDLIVLDLGLPDIDGVEIIRKLRTWTPVPVIVVSGRAGSADKVLALDAGADDYVSKPFNMEELLARLRAVIRRHAGASDAAATARIGSYDVDLRAHTIVNPAGGETVHLTRTEGQLLETPVPPPRGTIPQPHPLPRGL